MASSDPNNALVPPFGARSDFTPNPIAAGWSTANGPVPLDISTPVTSVGLVAPTHRVATFCHSHGCAMPPNS